jgi:hypothetical protein
VVSTADSASANFDASVSSANVESLDGSSVSAEISRGNFIGPRGSINFGADASFNTSVTGSLGYGISNSINALTLALSAGSRIPIFSED